MMIIISEICYWKCVLLLRWDVELLWPLLYIFLICSCVLFSFSFPCSLQLIISPCSHLSPKSVFMWIINILSMPLSPSSPTKSLSPLSSSSIHFRSHSSTMAVTALSRTLMTSWRVLLQPPHSCVSLPTPTQCLNLSLISFVRHSQSVPRLWSKGRICLQVNPAPRVRSARTYCQTITLYRSIRKNLLQSIHRALRRAHVPRSKLGIWTWCGTPLCMAFLAPPATQEAKKEVLQLPVQPEMKPKKRGWLSQLFVSVYEFLNLCLRALRLAVTFTPILMLYPVTYLGSTATDAWWALMLTGESVLGSCAVFFFFYFFCHNFFFLYFLFFNSSLLLLPLLLMRFQAPLHCLLILLCLLLILLFLLLFL